MRQASGVGLDVVPFTTEHIGAAGHLLAARHAHDRLAEPLLSPRFEAPAMARVEIERAWSDAGASGAAALRDGRLVGYLVGAPRDSAVWGENVWVDAAGQAVEDPETVRDLYAAAAAGWFEQGRNRHYVLVPASDPLVDAWFQLGFGQQQAHGAREVSVLPDVALPEGVEIREPRAGDIEELLEVDLVLPRHNRSSPVFSARPLPTAEALWTEWQSTLDGDVETVLIGCVAGRPVACWSFCDVDRSCHHQGLTRPDRACYLSFAATLPEARGLGVGTALTEAAVSAAAEQGYATMVTDWRVTNLLASRFWPRRGFRTSFLRLYRSIP
jgi:ribosomal protein S18 acetylase RimI-like enzyme